jgi:RimJ/RimL family protein N-acetyltransferase
MADAEEVFKCITPAIARFMRWEPPQSFNEYKAHREARLQANDQSVFSFVIRSNDTMECLGIAGLEEADQSMPELGIWLKKQLMVRAMEEKPLKRLVNGRRKISRRRVSFTRGSRKYRQQAYRRKT